MMKQCSQIIQGFAHDRTRILFRGKLLDFHLKQPVQNVVSVHCFLVVGLPKQTAVNTCYCLA